MFQDRGPEESGGLKGLLARRGVIPMLGAVAVLLIIIGFAGLVLSSGNGDQPQVGAQPTRVGESAGLATTLPTPEATIDLNRPTAVIVRNPEVPAPGAEGDRFIISRFGINAPVSYKAVGPDGVMPDPNGPDDVAFYDFSTWQGLGGFPGQGGNVVVSGHVDSGRVACKNGTVPAPCQAVFWDIGKLMRGDEVEFHVGGEIFRYRVTSNQAVHAVTADWNAIVASTAEETITMITCGGNFNPQTRTYDHRQVVVGVRI
jgi:LPXTG-site transpeptidase (sortase) family protein